MLLDTKIACKNIQYLFNTSYLDVPLQAWMEKKG